jgi:hypothetical protein
VKFSYFMKSLLSLILVCTLTPLLSSFGQENPQLYKLQSPFERYRHNSITVRGLAALPLGGLSSDYIDKSSIENYSVALEWIFPKAPVSAGIEIGKTYFQKRLPRDMYSNPDWDISAVQTRTLSLTPIQGFVNYNIAGVNSIVQPYVQASAGVNVVNYILYLGSLGDQYQKLRFGYGIGAGSKFLFKRDSKFGADIRIRYNNATFDYGYLEKGAPHVTASFGLFYRWW